MSEQTLDVIRGRRAERERLIAARLKLDPEYRAAQTLAIGVELDRLIPCTPGTNRRSHGARTMEDSPHAELALIYVVPAFASVIKELGALFRCSLK